MSQPAERGESRAPIRREDFGPDRAGQMDYLLMLSNPACEAFIDEKKTLCGKPAIRILDFDTATTTEQLPVCGDLCELSSTEIIVREASERGKIPALGVNGWGRGRMQDGVTS